ncbi:MAG: hypothetical protein WAK17_04330 [Candidatus Nitrosopolaris sp.]
MPAGEMARILMKDNGRIAKMTGTPQLVTSWKTFWTRKSAANGSSRINRSSKIVSTLDKRLTLTDGILHAIQGLLNSQVRITHVPAKGR